MNPLKHMEVIFGIVAVAALLVAALPDRNSHASTGRDAAGASEPVATIERASGSLAGAAAQYTSAAMPIVIIKGKRLNAREKRRAAFASLAALPVPAMGQRNS